MSVSSRLTKVFKSSKEVSFDDTSQIILFSDCHRGDNSWSDEFADNHNIFYHALDHYFNEGYTYIELGDGDELWENASFEDTRSAHYNVFDLMSKFHKQNRLHLMWGNHNRQWKKSKDVAKHLYSYYDELSKTEKPLFPGISVHEGIVLRHRVSGKALFLAHGHQGDFLNDRFWWLGRFVVRNAWKALQLFGVKDLTRPAMNFEKRTAIEKNMVEWSRNNRQALVVGHTHRPSFPGNQMPPYFNTGCCVHPRCIIGIEINEGAIQMVKWFVDVTKQPEGHLFVNKEVVGGPRSFKDVLL